MQVAYTNQILRALAPEALDRLHLSPVNLAVGHEIEFPGSPTNHLFFLQSGMASTTTTFIDGSQAEIAMAGIESVVGASALVGARRSLNRVYMQIAGTGLACTLANARAEFRRFDRFHDLCLRSLQAQFIQSAQTAGCNARHSVQQRLARWLLLCANRSGSASFYLSQEFMADMLGNSRPTVSVLAAEFQSRGLIRYQRGQMVILDPVGLEQSSCECFRVVLDYLEDFVTAPELESPAPSKIGPSHHQNSALPASALPRPGLRVNGE